MSVADRLGRGSSFSATKGGVSARRQAIAQAAGAPTTGAPDSRLKTLPLAQLTPTRFNPRRNFGTDEELREFGLKVKAKQLAPAVAVTRAAYLALWPDEANDVSTPYVLANGERRYRGSLAAEAETLEVIIDDTIAESRATFLDAVQAENNEREDLNPIERAIGMKTMVDELGGPSKVAEYYKKSPGWVTQQMYLLTLAPEIQELVATGEIPVREARELRKLPDDEQLPAWQNKAEERAQKAATRTRRPRTTQEDGFTAVKPPPPPSPPAGEDLPAQRNESTRKVEPSQLAPGESGLALMARVTKMPWHDGNEVADLVLKKMEAPQQQVLLQRLLAAHNQPPHP